MSENLYAAPKADVSEVVLEKNPIANKMNRFLAALIDGVLLMCVVIPMMFFMGSFDSVMKGQDPTFVQNLMIGFSALVVFFVLNTNLLKKHGQTIGKKLLGIKIVDLDGNLPTFSKHLVKRYGMYFGLGYIPVVGQILSLINILFVFGKDARCGHDHLAGTKVVDC